jgi:hypothetical protein
MSVIPPCTSDNLLALATLANATKIEMVLFVSRHPKKVRNVSTSQNGRFSKWQVTKIPYCQLAEWQFNKMTSVENGNKINWVIDEIAS